MNLFLPIYRRLTRASRGFHQDEAGATLTEFALTLPIWIVMFGGIISVGQLGIGTTANHLSTQTELWDNVVEASTDKNEEHMFPAAAGAAAAMTSAELASRSENPHPIADGANAAVMGDAVISRGLASGGTLGESRARTLPLKAVPGNTIPEKLSHKPEEILEVGSPFPHKVTHDGLAGSSWKTTGSGSVTSKIAHYAGSAMAASGAVAALAAGARYGEVYAAKEDTVIPLAFGNSIKASSHANLLVAPSALTGNEAEYTPYIIARILAEGEHNYAVALRFGKSEWPTGDDDSLEFDPDIDFDPEEIADDARDEAEELQEKGDECTGDNPPSDCDSFCADHPYAC